MRRLAALESDSETIGKAFDNNTDIYREGFSVLDASVFVLMRVMNDTLMGRVHMGEDGVDWIWYKQQYHACLAVLDFLIWVASLATPPSVSKEEDVVVFGGDA